MISALLFVLCQPPQAVSPDTIRLKSGTELEGRIVKETADYVEMRLAAGMIVGFEKARAAAIVRGVAESAHAASELDIADDDVDSGGVAVGGRNQWYALHDDGGRAIGWLHESSRRATDGGQRIGEEWRFLLGDFKTEITLLETLDHRGHPESCFYHERVLDADDRVRVDRLVRGVVVDGRLQVQRRSMRDSSNATYDFEPHARFPLELREELRDLRRPVEVAFDVFDPRRDEWRRARYSAGGMRAVADNNGGKRRVRTLIEHREDTSNVEWLDAASTSVRREINGPSLVAMPTTESSARGLWRSQDPVFEAALAVEASGRFALRLPNPMWEIHSQLHGQVTANCATHDATMSFVVLDQLGDDVLLDSAVDTVLRWLRLAHGDVDFGPRQPCRIRGRAAVRVLGEYEVRGADRGSRVVRRQCEVVVLGRAGGTASDALASHYLSFCADAPREVFAELESDFARAFVGLETRPASLAGSASPSTRPGAATPSR